MVAIKNIAVAALVAGLADQALAMPISGSAYETRDLQARRPWDEGSLAQFFIGYRKLFRASHGFHDQKQAKTHTTKAKSHTETHAEDHAEADKASASASTPEPAPEPAAEETPAEEAPAEEAPAAEAASEELRDYQMEFDERDMEERSYYQDMEEREIELDERDIEELYARYLASMEESEE
ncbi:unnamed protein product [Clonostachys solani]|uniref:Uncharacterized protein n=1 Tax=Clonostachys solani TaxID=160281 RepID=A0A9N9W6T8_9HYPO|nr:unnamed protein product [Clonostachys solani]